MQYVEDAAANDQPPSGLRTIWIDRVAADTPFLQRRDGDRPLWMVILGFFIQLIVGGIGKQNAVPADLFSFLARFGSSNR